MKLWEQQQAAKGYLTPKENDAAAKEDKQNHYKKLHKGQHFDGAMAK
jgi:hypothetical protein